MATICMSTFSSAVALDAPRAVPFSEDFENAGVIPDGWTQEYVVHATDWCFQAGGNESQPPNAHGGSYSACFFATDYDGHVTKLVSPMLDFGLAPQSPQLTFWHCMTNWDGDQDELRVYYKTTSEGPWVLLETYSEDTAEWTQRTLVLPSPSSTYFIAFEGSANYGYGACIDDVYVSSAATAPAIVTESPLPSGFVGVPYRLALSASGGVTPYTWDLVANALPEGLSLDNDGVISGTPESVTNISFQVSVTGHGLSSTNLFSLAILSRRAIPFTETFESAGNMPDGWTQEYAAHATDWSFQEGGNASQPPSAHSGSYNAFFYINDYSFPRTKLITPPLDFGASTKNAQLTFWHCMRNWGGDQDELRVYYRTSSGGTWLPLAEFTSDVSAWIQRTIPLPNPSRTYFIAFEGCAKFGSGVCIDDVVVSGETSPYTIWQTNQFTEAEFAAGGIAGDTDDPDNDGIANLLEYAMGLNPRLYDSAGFPVGGVLDQYLTLNYRQNKQATDLIYQVEACTNLTAGGWTTNGLTEISRSDSNRWWSVTTRHDVPMTNAPSRFLRLKITLP